MKKYVAFGFVCSLALTAGAAERIVLWEDFTATWCGPCHTLAVTMEQFWNAYPTTNVMIQQHINSSDIYYTQWGHNRFLSYGNSQYIPDVWIDGSIQQVGTTSYQTLLDYYNARRAAPTDITVLLGARQLDPNNPGLYEVTCRLSMDANGTAKDVRVAMVRALDHYPPGWTDTRWCLVGGGNNYCGPADQYEYTVTNLQPGQTVDVKRNFQWDSFSLGRPQDMRLIAWAQAPVSQTPWYYSRPVYNSKMISYPFSALTNPGDLNCDGAVDFDDINPFVLALSDPAGYNQAYPNCNIMNGDCNGDGVFNFDDINPFVALLSS
ncbi:MAG: thioredoxin domain-containing protein [Planctomycetota bacterium]